MARAKLEDHDAEIRLLRQEQEQEQKPRHGVGIGIGIGAAGRRHRATSASAALARAGSGSVLAHADLGLLGADPAAVDKAGVLLEVRSGPAAADATRSRRRSSVGSAASAPDAIPYHAGLLKSLAGALPRRAPAARYVEVSGSVVRIFRLRRSFLERLRGKRAATGLEPQNAIEARMDRAHPLLCIDLRLARVDVEPAAAAAGEPSSLLLRGVEGETLAQLRAASRAELMAWAACMEQQQRDYAAAQLRRSRAISMGIAPARAPKPDMTPLATTNPAVDEVESVPRKQFVATAARILGSLDAVDAVAADADDVYQAAALRQRNGFSVLSFNVLADRYVTHTNTPLMYAHCDRACLRWSYRARRILRHVTRCGADLICLQEVERDFFEAQLLPSLGRRGYAGEIECNTRKDGQELPGTATFYRAALFEVAWRERAYRSLLLGLRMRAGRERGSVLALANSHLEGNPLRAKDRASQLRSVLRKLERRREEHRFALLCGDYNDGARSALCQQLLGGERFVSAYDGHAARDVTCLLVPDDARAVDIEAGRVDHVFYDSRLRLRAVLDVMEPSWSREAVIEQGLPSLVWPSDHLSVGAVLEFNQASERFRVQDPAAEPEPEDPFRTRSSSDILRDTSLNPLSESECERWLEHEAATTYGHPEARANGSVGGSSGRRHSSGSSGSRSSRGSRGSSSSRRLSGVASSGSAASAGSSASSSGPAQGKKKKLSPLEIEWRQAASAKKAAFVEQLSPEKQEFVRNMTALRRREAKERDRIAAAARKKSHQQQRKQQQDGQQKPRARRPTMLRGPVEALRRMSVTRTQAPASPSPPSTALSPRSADDEDDEDEDEDENTAAAVSNAEPPHAQRRGSTHRQSLPRRHHHNDDEDDEDDPDL